MIERRRRLPDGTFSGLEKIGNGLTDKEKMSALEQENTALKLALVETVAINEEINTQTQLAIAELAAIISGGEE